MGLIAGFGQNAISPLLVARLPGSVPLVLDYIKYKGLHDALDCDFLLTST